MVCYITKAKFVTEYLFSVFCHILFFFSFLFTPFIFVESSQVDQVQCTKYQYMCFCISMHGYHVDETREWFI